MTIDPAGRRRGGWYHGWNIVAVCVLSGIAANGLAINSFSLFLKAWSVDLGTRISTLQLGIASCGLGCAVISPLIGMVVDRFPARLVFGAGLAGMTVFCLALSMVTTTVEFMLLYGLLLPLSLVAATTVPSNALVSRWFVRRLGLALGLTAFGLGMAGVVMPPVIAVVMPVVGWRGLWRIGGLAIGLVVLPVTLAVLRDRPHERDGDHYLSGTAARHGHGHSGALRWRDILTSRNFWLMVLVYPPMLALYGGVGQNLAPIATSRGLGAGDAGMMLSLLSLSQITATLGAGMLSDRFGNRLPLAGLALVTACSGVFTAFGTTLPMLAIGATLAGAGGAFWPLLAAAASREFGAAGVGRAFGALIFFLPLAVTAPFLVARNQETSGSYVPSLMVLTVVTVVTGLVCLAFMRERGIVDAEVLETVPA
jgi:MFS family permease